MSLDEALSLSLNVPFVHLLDRLGLESFLGTLRSAGFRHLRPEPGFYGLSAAIGAVDVTPLEMAGLYAALAEDGRWRPLRVLATPARASGEVARATDVRFVANRDTSNGAPAMHVRLAAERAGTGDGDEPRIFSPAAAWLTRRTLRAATAPTSPNGASGRVRLPTCTGRPAPATATATPGR